MQTNQELIEHLTSTGMLKTARITYAFFVVDRADFVREENLREAYEDYPLPIGFGQTISQPSTVAFMLELLQPKPEEKILDVGSGSGWTTALLAHIVGAKGAIFGVELIPELTEFGQKNLGKYGFKNAQIKQAATDIIGLPAGRQGLPEFAPYDKILVSASAEQLPDELVRQLKIGGRLVIPVLESVFKIDRIAEREISRQEFPGFVFVPLR